jgi:DNA-binding XRE family transcriptional regulator
MKDRRKKGITRKKWKLGSAEEFLGLSPEEAAYIEMKLSLSRQLRARRVKKRMTQVELAGLISSSQSRVAKMEAGDPSVSLDLLIRSLMALGATRREIARAIERKPSRAAS